jgi:hypothetical protein
VCPSIKQIVVGKYSFVFRAISMLDMGIKICSLWFVCQKQIVYKLIIFNGMYVRTLLNNYTTKFTPG